VLARSAKQHLTGEITVFARHFLFDWLLSKRNIPYKLEKVTNRRKFVVDLVTDGN